MARVWHHFAQPVGLSPQGVFIDALMNAGVKTHECAPPDPLPNGPGIIFFQHLDQNLLDLVAEVSHNGLERILAIATSGSAPPDTSIWRLLRAGASDVLTWNRLQNPALEVAARFERWESVDRLVESPLVRENLVGKSCAWISVLRQAVEVAYFTQASMLITGESGTGKELIARLVHTLDPRPDKGPLVVLDCTTIVPELSGSEFFGHERGAFTGAVAPRDGAFALANGGTLFIDEVGDLSLRLQAELLRVVQEGTYKRVGSNQWQKTKFRLVCATNKDLRLEELEGRFRRDFYYRIAGCPCQLPPLRVRSGDIVPLAHYFLRQLSPREETPELDEPVSQYLRNRDYPGNVRDLKQLVSRMSYRHVGLGPITAGDIPEDERPQAEVGPEEWRDAGFELSIRRAVALGVGLKEISQAAADTAIRIAVADEQGNLQRASIKLGVTDRALQMRRATARLQRSKRAGRDNAPA